jgi:hypothetical protein
MLLFFTQDEISFLFPFSLKSNKTSPHVLAACQSTLSDKDVLDLSTKANIIYITQ